MPCENWTILELTYFGPLKNRTCLVLNNINRFNLFYESHLHLAQYFAMQGRNEEGEKFAKTPI